MEKCLLALFKMVSRVRVALRAPKSPDTAKLPPWRQFGRIFFPSSAKIEQDGDLPDSSKKGNILKDPFNFPLSKPCRVQLLSDRSIYICRLYSGYY